MTLSTRFPMMHQIEVEGGQKFVKSHIVALMKLMRENRYKYFKLFASGTEHMQQLESILKHLNNLVYVMAVVCEEKGTLTAVVMRSKNFTDKFEKAK